MLFAYNDIGEQGMDTSENSLIKLLKEMFEEMVIKKDPSKISQYYHPDFLLFTNGESWDYSQFLESHEKIYQTPIQYKLKYDEETFLEQGNKLAARIYITTQIPEEPAKEIELILIAQFKDLKIYRLWELTYPDWSKMPAFKSISAT